MSAEAPVVEQQQAPTTLSFKWMVDSEQFMAIPGAKKVRINRKLGSAVVEFETAEAAAAAVAPTTLEVTIDSRPFDKKRSARKPKKAAAKAPAAKREQKPKAEKKAREPRAPREPREPRTSVLCTPDVSAQAADVAKLVLLKPENTATGGRIYQSKPELDTKHVASLKFAPVLNSVILPQVNFGPVAIDVDSIRVLPEAEGFAVIISVNHPETGHRGVLALNRSLDADGNLVTKSTRSFNLLVNPEDKAKGKEEEVPVYFISIESINVDPETGLWADLQMALDCVNAPFNTLLNKRKSNRNRGRKAAEAEQTPE